MAGRVPTVSLSQLIHLGIMMLAKVIAQAIRLRQLRSFSAVEHVESAEMYQPERPSRQRRRRSAESCYPSVHRTVAGGGDTLAMANPTLLNPSAAA